MCRRFPVGLGFRGKLRTATAGLAHIKPRGLIEHAGFLS
jgi:hypothetical protein